VLKLGGVVAFENVRVSGKNLISLHVEMLHLNPELSLPCLLVGR
jgi:hypothetical protein